MAELKAPGALDWGWAWRVEVSHSKVRPKSSTPLMSMSSMVSLLVIRILIRVVGRFVFLEVILQAFTIDSEGQWVVMSSGVMSWGTFRITTENVGFLGLG
jgi:NAD/NADP transhydrogenase alpha subunit